MPRVLVFFFICSIGLSSNLMATSNSREGWFMQGDWLITCLRVSKHKKIKTIDSLIIGVNYRNQIFEYYNKANSSSVLVHDAKFRSNDAFLDNLVFEKMDSNSVIKHVAGFRKINENELYIYKKNKRIGKMTRLLDAKGGREVGLGKWYFNDNCFKRKSFSECGSMNVTANPNMIWTETTISSDMLFEGNYHGNVMKGDFDVPITINVMVFNLNLSIADKPSKKVLMIYNSRYLMVAREKIEFE